MRALRPLASILFLGVLLACAVGTGSRADGPHGMYPEGYWPTNFKRSSNPFSPIVAQKMLVTPVEGTDHILDYYDNLESTADSVVDIGTDYTGYFAYGLWSTQSTDSFAINSSAQGKNFRYGMWAPSPDSLNPWDDSGVHYGSMVYIDWKSVLPPGSDVISAKLHFTAGGQQNIGAQDTLVAVLMTNPADSAWYRYVGANTRDFMSFCSLMYQRQGVNDAAAGDQATLTSRGFPAKSGPAWDPEITSRTREWDWGDYADWSCDGGDQGFGTASHTADSLFTIDITNCVRAANAGRVNNGIFLYKKDDSSIGYTQIRHFDPTSPDDNEFAFFEIDYVTRVQKPRWPNQAKYAFVFCTDDWRRNANMAYKAVFDTFDSRIPGGAKMTIFGSAKHYPNANVLTLGQVQQFIRDGHEVGFHSMWHANDAGGLDGFTRYRVATDEMIVNEYTRGMYPDTLTASATNWDSLLYDSDPEWLYYVLEDSLGVDYRNHPLVGKSMALPFNMFDPATLQAMAYHNYLGVRGNPVGNLTLADGNRTFGVKATTGFADTDTMWACWGNSHAEFVNPVNATLLPPWVSSNALVGDSTVAATVDDYIIKNRVRRWARQVSAGDFGVFGIYTHDLRTEAGKTGGYSNGIDAAELEVILQAVEETGGWVCTVSDMKRWMRSQAVADSIPSGWGQDGTAWDFTAEDDNWYLPMTPAGRDTNRGMLWTAAISRVTEAGEYPYLSGAWRGGPALDRKLHYKWQPHYDSPTHHSRVTTWTELTAASSSFATAGLIGDNIPLMAFSGDTISCRLLLQESGGAWFAADSLTYVVPTLPSIVTPLAAAPTPEVGRMWRTNYDLDWYSAGATPANPMPDSSTNDYLDYKVLQWNLCEASNYDMDPIQWIKNTRSMYNDDFMPALYVHYFGFRKPWGSASAGSYQRRMHDALIPYRPVYINGDTVSHYFSGDSNVYWLLNPLQEAGIDSLISIQIEFMFRNGWLDLPYTGVFIDWAYSDYPNWPCDGGDCTDFLDLDVDGTGHGSDANEQAAYDTAVDSFFTKLRRRLDHVRGDETALIVNNGDAAEQRASAGALLDGEMIEHIFNERMNTTEEFEALGPSGTYQQRFTNARVDPPLLILAEQDTLDGVRVSTALLAECGANMSQTTSTSWSDIAHQYGYDWFAASDPVFGPVYSTVGSECTAYSVYPSGWIVAMNFEEGSYTKNTVPYPYIVYQNNEANAIYDGNWGTLLLDQPDVSISHPDTTTTTTIGRGATLDATADSVMVLVSKDFAAGVIDTYYSTDDDSIQNIRLLLGEGDHILATKSMRTILDGYAGPYYSAADTDTVRLERGSVMEIDNVSGTLEHGQTLTITGVGFGTKASAPPTVFDSFESGTNNQVFGPSPIGDVGEYSVWGSEGGNFRRPRYRENSERAWGGDFYAEEHPLSEADFFTGFYKMHHDWEDSFGTKTMYASMKVRITTNAQGGPWGSGSFVNPSVSQKLFRLTSYNRGPGMPPQHGNPNLWLAKSGGTSVVGYYLLNSGIGAQGAYLEHNWSDWTGMNDVWVDCHLWMKIGTDGNTDGLAGHFWKAENGLAFSVRDSTGMETYTEEGPDYPDELPLIRGLRAVAWSCQPGGWEPDELYLAWDNLYADTSLARVIIGDNSEYYTCRTWEPQPPTAWADDEIQVTANLNHWFDSEGATIDTLYAWVVDTDNNVSDQDTTVAGKQGKPIAMTPDRPTFISTVAGEFKTASACSVTIRGFSFGTKNPAAPLIWEDFDDFAAESRLDSTLAGGQRWSIYSDNDRGFDIPRACDWSHRIKYTGDIIARFIYPEHSHPDNYQRDIIYKPLYGMSADPDVDYLGPSDRFYWSMWSLSDFPGPETADPETKQWKRARLSDGPYNADTEPYIGWFWHRALPDPPNNNPPGRPFMCWTDDQLGSTGSAYCPDLVGGQASQQFVYDIPDTGVWNCFEMYGQLDSGAQQCDARVWAYMNQEAIVEENDPKAASVGLFIDDESGPGEMWVGEYIQQASHQFECFWDDIYFDDTWARVILGNAEQYDDCTYIQLQIPYYWDDNLISFKVNLGEWPSGYTGYLYVVTADGEFSDADLSTPAIDGKRVLIWTGEGEKPGDDEFEEWAP